MKTLELNRKLATYLQESKTRHDSFYEKNPTARRFATPQLFDTVVQERIMRLGIEARALELTTEDELYACATSTLHDDYIKHRNKT